MSVIILHVYVEDFQAGILLRFYHGPIWHVCAQIWSKSTERKKERKRVYVNRVNTIIVYFKCTVCEVFILFNDGKFTVHLLFFADE